MSSRRRGGAGRPPWPVSSGVVLLLREVSPRLRGGEGLLSTPARSPARGEVGGGRSGTADTEPVPVAWRGCGVASGKEDGMGVEGCWAGEDRAEEAVQ